MVEVKREDREAVAVAVFGLWDVPPWVEPWVRTGDDDDVPFHWPGRVAVVIAARRERVEKAEGERDEIKRIVEALSVRDRIHEDYNGLRDKFDKAIVELESTMAERAKATAERDSIARHRDELVEELSDLREQCAVPDSLRVWAINSRVYGESQLREACDFILQFCKPEPKTRLDMYVEGWLEDGGDADPAMLVSVREEGRKQLRRQGLEPDEVMP